jgi:hypothetical protein
MLAGRTSQLCAQIACLNRQPCAIERRKKERGTAGERDEAGRVIEARRRKLALFRVT